MRKVRDDQSFDSRFDAAFQPGFEETSSALPVFESESVLFGDTEGSETSAATATRPARGLVDRFVVVLWIIGVAFIAGGVVSSAITTGLYGSSLVNFTPDFFMISVLSLSSQWLVPVGLATLVGTVFLLAVRWEHRP